MQIVREKISIDELKNMADALYGDLVKAVVDIERGIMAIGGDLHADEEALLLEDGSKQQHLWGMNIRPDKPKSEWIEFDSMINLRPSQGNRSRGVDDPITQQKIKDIVSKLTG